MGPGLTQERGQVWELQDADSLRRSQPSSQSTHTRQVPRRGFRERLRATALLRVCNASPFPTAKGKCICTQPSQLFFQMKIGLER